MLQSVKLSFKIDQKYIKIGRINIIENAILAEAIYKHNATLIKIPV